jgi:4-amino-4-deoxy-L-arabinose transferase-like glycosyltransferase
MKTRPYWKSPAVFVFVAVAAYFSVFFHLDTLSMRVWDESSYALNAQEMLERKNPVEVYLLGQPDTYNSKPPFAIWCMAAGIYTFGFNELGARIAAALFAFLTALGLYVFGRFKLQSNAAALAMPLILTSSTGYIGDHIARTGDTDAILAFWVCAACVCLYLFTETVSSSRQRLYFLLSATSLTFACLTKGIAGLTPLPGMLAWLVYTGRLKPIFKQSYFYIGILIFILFPGYYVVRNLLTPGYLDAVMHFEIGGRLSRQEFLNPEKRGFFYFLEAMATENRFKIWILILPIALFWTFGRKEKTPLKRATIFFLFSWVGVMVSLGISSTKLFWYDAPLYPLMAGFIGCAFALMVSRVEAYYKWSMILFFLVVFSLPYSEIINQNVNRKEDAHLSDFLTRLRKDKQVSDTLYIIDADYNFSIYFYAKQEWLKGYHSCVTHVNSTELTPGKLIVTCKYAREYDMNRMFVLDTLDSYKECRYYKIKSIR